MTNAFTTLNALAATINTLAALAEEHFGTAPLLGQARLSHTPDGVAVLVQMTEANVLAWCEANGVTAPPFRFHEADYTMYGGGYTTHRLLDVVVAEAKGGRLILVCCETQATRPAVPATEEAVA